jgi:hypothetical protein
MVLAGLDNIPVAGGFLLFIFSIPARLAYLFRTAFFSSVY